MFFGTGLKSSHYFPVNFFPRLQQVCLNVYVVKLALCWYMLRKPTIDPAMYRQAHVYDAGQHLNSIEAVYTMCTHSRQHEVLTRAEWILGSTGDTGPTFNRHWFGVSLYLLPAVNTARPACYLMQC